MIQVSDALKDAFLSSRQKNLTLNFSDGTSLTNDSIVIESMKLDQLLCSESQITFGLCNAAQFSVSIFNGMVSHKDLIVRPVISVVDDNGTEHSLQLGVFKVIEDAVSDDRNTRALTCYDALYDVVNENYADWYTALKLPMTLKAFRDSFFNRIGIQQVAIDLPNDSMTVEKTIETNSLSGSAILKAILEPNASFGFINYEGKFQYTLWKNGTGLFPATDLYPSEDLYPAGITAAKFGTTEESGVVVGSLVYADYTVGEITGVKIQTSSEDVGMVAGKTGNTYQILGNFLLYGKGDTELRTIGNNFLEYADQLFFRPCKFKARCHPWLELGDMIALEAKSFRIIMPILRRTITGITALFDEYEAQGSEKYAEQANSLNTMVETLKKKSLEIVTSVDEVRSTIGEVEDGQTVMSTISQLPHTISLSVSGRAGRSSSEGGAGITITLKDKDGNTVSSGSGTVYINGNVIFTSNLTDGTTTISGDNLKTGTISAASISLYDGSTLASSTYYTEINASTGKLRWNSEGSSMTSAGYLTINNGVVNKNVTVYGSLNVYNSETGYYTRANASTGNLTWNMQNSTLSSTGVLTVKNSTYSQVELGSGRIRFILTDKGSSYINAMYATGDNTVHLSIDAPNQVILSSSLTPSPIYVEDSEGGESYSGYPKLQVIGRSYFSNCLYLNHSTVGTVKIRSYQQIFSSVSYKAIWVPNLVTGNAIWSNGPIYQKSQHDGYGYMYATVTGEDIRTGSYSFNVPHNTWKSIDINFNIAMADTPTVVATLCTSSRIDPDGITVEVYGVSASGFGICIANNSTAYGDIDGLTVNYFAIVKRV